MTNLILISIALFCIASLGYVYAFRGRVRWTSFDQYLRKGWPIFTPFNCLLYLFTQPRARVAIMNLEDFPELAVLQENAGVICEEAMSLVAAGGFDSITDPKNDSYYDIGFRTFYKYDWTKYYLKWYGYTHASARQSCPKTVELLRSIPSVNGAMFSILRPGGQLTPHLDPVACSLRYHLGLNTPNHKDCYINVDGDTYSWKDREALLFDITFMHFARNETDQPRLILMCDIERPMSWVGGLLNWPYKLLMRASVVPNTDADRRGLANRMFSSMAPLLEKSKHLKQTNLRIYKFFKYVVNTTVLAALAAGIYLLIEALRWLF